MISSLQNRVALITGATKGIGKGIAVVLSGSGARILLVARHSEEGEESAASIRRIGGIASFKAGDVTSLESMQQAAAEAFEQFGRLDILCANAGIFPEAPLDKLSETQWESVMNVNVKGLLFSLQACLPYLRKSDAGRVVITSSITGPVTGFPGWCHYGASKAAQLGFMRTAAIELARDNVTVNAVLPGNIVTEGLQALGEAYLQQMAASIPLRRLGAAEDIGHAVAFLASPEAGYITGQTIIVDGGQTLPESLVALGN